MIDPSFFFASQDRQDGKHTYPKSFRIVKIFMSTLGPVDYQAFYLDSIDCEFGEPRVGTKFWGKALCDPKKWQGQLPDLNVDSRAHGIVHWVLVDDGAEVEQMFPIRTSCKLRTKEGKKLTFSLSALAP